MSEDTGCEERGAVGAAERGLRGRGSRRKGWSWRDTQHGEGLSFTGEEEWGKEAGQGRQRKCRGGTEPRRSPLSVGRRRRCDQAHGRWNWQEGPGVQL